jgi:hypothetical protein
MKPSSANPHSCRPAAAVYLCLLMVKIGGWGTTDSSKIRGRVFSLIFGD